MPSSPHQEARAWLRGRASRRTSPGWSYLASDEARYVTAQLIRVDGGITSHAPSYADTRRALGQSDESD